MCGIAGAVDFGQFAPDARVLEAMERALVPRGPDAGGILIDGACGLAHRRLSIIDLEQSSQPMRVGGSDCSLVYNGELYNYRQLKSAAQRDGHRFETEGDSEVLLRTVESQGLEGLQSLDGMFSFGLWNRRRRQLLLARDPLGIKPLFYSQPRSNLLVFGSEIKAVLCHPEVKTSLDQASLRQALRFRAVYGRDTLYAGIRELEPGHYLQFSADGIESGRFFILEDEVAAARKQLATMSEREQATTGESLLCQAVEKRLLADVPVGAFLSGGVDSSLIVALICEIRKQRESTLTFSVGFRGDAHSEVGHAAAVAKAVGASNEQVLLDTSDYLSLFAPMTIARDAPISEPADLAIGRMSQVAKEQVKVVLTGEGADEVFAGYPKYRFAGIPNWLSRSLATAGQERLLKIAGLLGMDRRRARVALNALTQPTPLQRLVHWFSYLERESLASLFPGLGFTQEQWEETYWTQRLAADCFGAFTPLQVMQGVDCLTWLPGNLLERGDRMTMAAGLEARVPYLDKALVAYGIALKNSAKVRGNTMKRPVRSWSRQRLPPTILKRRKWGFRVPLANWFRGGLRSLLHDTLLAKGGLCGQFADRDAVVRLLESHDRGERDCNLELWTILATEIWYQRVFQKQQSQRSLAHAAGNS